MNIKDKIIARADLFENGFIVTYKDGSDSVVLVSTDNVSLEIYDPFYVKNEPMKDLFIAVSDDGSYNWITFYYGENGEYRGDIEAFDSDSEEQVFMTAKIYHRDKGNKKINGKFLITDFKTHTLKLVDSII